MTAAGFLARFHEKAEHNQYWYSPKTIEAITQEVLDGDATRCAFLSTPSVFYSLPPDSKARQNSAVFDLDPVFGEDKEVEYVQYDFNKPEAIPASLHGTFDMVVIDPPFITRDVWEKYAAATKLLLKENGRILLTTIGENAKMLAELMPGVKPRVFKPAIPNLIYQYSLYTNYDSERLAEPNPEIPEDDEI
ncbi:unnamed protein product [Pedinophyceae sp. YPF-701]|nr:unnamed protein product [Pedinophyceae sp. YPF-701]